MTIRPRWLHILVEGQTEETLVRNVLEPHLARHGFSVSQSILVTRRVAGTSWNRGGVGSWTKLAAELRLLLRNTRLDVLTTVIDYYGLPSDTPGWTGQPAGSARQRVEYIEAAMADDVDDSRFVPHLVMHETEAWVFAAADQLGELYGDPDLARKMHDQTARAGGVELIDDGPQTAPSKRILALRPSYVKTADGPLAVADLGLPALRAACPHLHDWLRRLGA